MLENSSLFLMLLLGAGSIIGIRSAAYDQPEVAIAQPQPQPQKPIPGTQGLITQQRAETLAQASVDKILLDRLFPQIIKRIDGNTLLQKIDAKTLAAKVLPYLDISASVVRRDGVANKLDVNDIARDLGLTGAEPLSSTAKCNNGEIAVGGGFRFYSDPEDSYVGGEGLTGENGWHAYGLMTDNGNIQASATCLTLNVGLKGAPQPQPQPQQPSSPPGGPPLQSPSGPVVR
jgi:hypothetical protein